ncbi:hypothetical protein GE107_09530 [Cohnella sp. CFH 77786]|uniref:hypothetical protein n=1 Tax=Cohnella sp. CFH 77786 TaxID=2662265 RepID=UPI001C60D984|nr:hypothetical protein [Cohnella sp. CFH 77786]MBW5446299.1 hypothetical protein [Cohnella sp. CFH 77786]
MKSAKLSAVLGMLVVLAVVLMFPRYSYNDPDTFWHLELGRYMVDHRTVLHHAIHTFYGDKLPYVPHEYAFQIVLALLYSAFGWPGAYLLTAVCLLLLILGMDRLTSVSRMEIGLHERHPALLPLVLLAACWIYYNYFATRPQMVSAWMIVWFVVFLRGFQMKPRTFQTIGMIVLSLAVANFHAGVWLVIAAFTGMAILETLWEKRWTKRHAAAFGAVLLAGLANPGGPKSILYILTVTKGDFNMLINEWQPIPFAKPVHFPILLLLLFFAAILPFTLHRKPFRYLFMLGILYLGVSSFKQNLFMWLFIPYFAATLPEEIAYLRNLRARFDNRTLLLCLAIGLSVNIAINFCAFPPRVNETQYPVKEMDYLLQQTATGHRPKVMAPYGASGYVMFRGGNVLCDGRQDPFVTDESKGALGWNAFQRSMYGYGEYLPEIVRDDKPEYVITRAGVSGKLYRDWVREFGEPVFTGPYGSVFAIVRP